LGGKDAQGEEHRTEATEVTEGDESLAPEGAWGDSFTSGRETRIGEEHRTEAAEVTEGDRGLHGGRRFGDSLVWSGKDASLYQMPPRAWRPGLEPAELSFRVPHFFHQT
jgi:hypothetical protein